jgi:hypothetical protein
MGIRRALFSASKRTAHGASKEVKAKYLVNNYVGGVFARRREQY